MSGLACTRRTCEGSLEEGAILMESLDEVCGDDPAFTATAVIDDLPVDDVVADFLYQRERPPELYPEELPDSKSVFRVRYADGSVSPCVCTFKALRRRYVGAVRKATMSPGGAKQQSPEAPAPVQQEKSNG